ncbi:MFS transporter [Chromobacterium phragmitis]|uniref:MFS transporter n=1 Tax=Chromobacterium phragmitis TaxID=2202141 RepID=UPI003D363F04
MMTAVTATRAFPMPQTVNHESLFSQGRVAASLGAIALISLLAFEAIAVAAAMPAVAAALGGLDFYAIAFGGTLATSVVGMVLGGEVCDRYGPARSAALGLAAFISGLLAAGAAPDIYTLVLGRLLQGLGSGLLGVAIYVGMSRAIPSALHPKLFAMFAGAWVVPALVGPSIAAGLVHVLGWRAVFLAVAVVAPIAGAMLLPALNRQRGHSRRAEPLRWPLLGWSLLAAAGALGLHGGSHLPAWPWMNTSSIALARRKSSPPAPTRGVPVPSCKPCCRAPGAGRRRPTATSRGKTAAAAPRNPHPPPPLPNRPANNRLAPRLPAPPACRPGFSCPSRPRKPSARRDSLSDHSGPAR